MQRMPFKHIKTDYLMSALEDALPLEKFNYRYPYGEKILLYNDLKCKGEPYAYLVETDMGTKLNHYLVGTVSTSYTDEEVNIIEALLRFYTYSE